MLPASDDTFRPIRSRNFSVDIESTSSSLDPAKHF